MVAYLPRKCLNCSGRERLLTVEGASEGTTPEWTWALLQAAPLRAEKDFWNWALFPSLPSATSFYRRSGSSGACVKVRFVSGWHGRGCSHQKAKQICKHSTMRWRVGRDFRAEEQIYNWNFLSYRRVRMGDDTGFSKFENHKEKSCSLNIWSLQSSGWILDSLGVMAYLTRSDANLRFHMLQKVITIFFW